MYEDICNAGERISFHLVCNLLNFIDRFVNCVLTCICQSAIHILEEINYAMQDFSQYHLLQSSLFLRNENWQLSVKKINF